MMEFEFEAPSCAICGIDAEFDNNLGFSLESRRINFDKIFTNIFKLSLNTCRKYVAEACDMTFCDECNILVGDALLILREPEQLEEELSAVREQLVTKVKNPYAYDEGGQGHGQGSVLMNEVRNALKLNLEKESAEVNNNGIGSSSAPSMANVLGVTSSSAFGSTSTIIVAEKSNYLPAGLLSNFFKVVDPNNTKVEKEENEEKGLMSKSILPPPPYSGPGGTYRDIYMDYNLPYEIWAFGVSQNSYYGVQSEDEVEQLCIYRDRDVKCATKEGRGSTKPTEANNENGSTSSAPPMAIVLDILQNYAGADKSNDNLVEFPTLPPSLTFETKVEKNADPEVSPSSATLVVDGQSESDENATSSSSTRKILTGSRKNNYLCVVCDEIFPGARTLGSHYQKGHDEMTNSGRWPCPSCDDVLGGRDQLYQHRYHVHKNLPINKAQALESKTNSSPEASEPKPKPKLKSYMFACVLCPETFIDEADIPTHYASVHKKTTKWTCHDCDDLFDSQLEVASHRWDVHDDVPLSSRPLQYDVKPDQDIQPLKRKEGKEFKFC